MTILWVQEEDGFLVRKEETYIYTLDSIFLCLFGWQDMNAMQKFYLRVSTYLGPEQYGRVDLIWNIWSSSFDEKYILKIWYEIF
jgi:hypothetical protein